MFYPGSHCQVSGRELTRISVCIVQNFTTVKTWNQLHMTLPIVWELAKDKTLWNMSEYLNKIAKVLL